MKAFLCRRYGPPEVLQLAEIPTPTPAANEILIRLRATTVNSGDVRLRSMDLPPGFGLLARLIFGLRRPRQPILGTELAGDVVAAGTDVSSFAVGDRVFAFPGEAMGCHTEYVCLPADGPVVAMPANLSYEQAAALSFGGSTVLDFFRRARLARGERLLVVGASGTVGTAAVQIARHLGVHVTGVCSGANAELVRSLGAERVIDHTREDFTRLGDSYDVILDAIGTASFPRARPLLAPGGRLLLVFAGLGGMLLAPWHSFISGLGVVAGPAEERIAYLHELAALAAAGTVVPVIDRAWPFAELVAAHRYVDLGHKRGSVVIRMEAAPDPSAVDSPG
ncbi:NAD(P)-dependent alcohol dehydrogenase [Synechococcus sp. CCY 9618]|uniref:NAD(P)-dependent alcohol dehydrogenase n=1 Tax=Synechococcus sp. CCY 9618 TaxID=2815602 RepID=UPI001C23902B|nr:NAD(P)-dependent alcohol dehydrogenase [Synechococcus sp. CCY 9618]